MNAPVRLRRPLVVLGVLLSLLAGVATIRAAAVWTAAGSPLVAKPPSVESLQAALATEQSRSAALLAQLGELTAGSTELTAALDVARNRIATDAAQADELQASLKTAKGKLAVLDQSIRQAQAVGGRAASASVGAPAAITAQAHDEDHEGGDDD
ncbi:MAG: hypothetical protein Q7S35_13140 [Candidatus Limnocylindrales bacterium]|nr:hypothetical protein [Candidatus Limnocylindrales bacterium]